MLRSIGKTFTWLFIVLLIAFTQMVIVWVFKKEIDMYEFIANGFFLFLSLGAISSIAYEFLMESDVEIGKYAKFWILIGAIIMALICMFLYATVYVDFDLTNPNIKPVIFVKSYKFDLVRSNVIIFFCTLIYSFWLKTSIYEHKRTIENGNHS